jgi:metal-dependent HD superfamily phosphatase/phosphodiesterase
MGVETSTINLTDNFLALEDIEIEYEDLRFELKEAKEFATKLVNNFWKKSQVKSSESTGKMNENGVKLLNIATQILHDLEKQPKFRNMKTECYVSVAIDHVLFNILGKFYTSKKNIKALRELVLNV